MTQVVDENEGEWTNDDFVSFVRVQDSEDEAEERDFSNGGFLNQNETIMCSGVLPPWMSHPSDAYINPLVRLHNEIVDFCSLMEPRPNELRQREKLVERFTRLAESCFKGCKVSVFGSQATGLLLPTSDIDITIVLKEGGKEDEETKTKENQVLQDQEDMENWNISGTSSSLSPLHILASALGTEWIEDLKYLEVIENTRVPLVKFMTTDGLAMDISFNQDNGPRAAALMKTFLQAMPPLRPLTFVLKYYLALRGLNEPYSGGIGSYMLQLMIVSFLQHRERDSYNHRRPSVYNLGCLLVEFMELYGFDFNYMTTGISVRHDGMYFPKGARNRKEVFLIPNRLFSLAMENPLDPTMDVGKPSFKMFLIQRAFDTSFKSLLAHVAEPVIPVPSILAVILPASPEMQHRSNGVNKSSQEQSPSPETTDVHPPERKRRRFR
mmetsp:Transcript_11498/g.16859  ORF Transcript_11498/g.16859 Transcript_11498/m.16859 type:complete len:438 (-) Transcript_11498:962-2275(-)